MIRVPRWMILGRFLAMLLVISAALVLVKEILRYPVGSDLKIYLWASRQIVEGGSPYGPIPDTHLKYLYAPWLAAGLIPMTLVPLSIATVAWQAFMAGCSALCIWPLVRRPSLAGILAAVLVGTFLFHAVWIGHVQPLLLAMLLVGLPGRWGPVAIGIAASLKVTPILLSINYLARGEWQKALVAVAVAVALWAPALLLGMADYGIGVYRSLSLLGYSAYLWALVAGLALGATWRLAATPFGWLAAAALWLTAIPNMILYDLASVVVGASGAGRRSGRRT